MGALFQDTMATDRRSNIRLDSNNTLMCEIYIWRKDKHIRYRNGSVGGKEFLVVGLKGLDAKTNWLTVSRQS
jgi:hypothetical protein